MTPLIRPLRSGLLALALLTALALPADALGSFSMTLTPPYVLVDPVNDTARYELRISNHGNASIVVHLTSHNVTAGWTLSYGPRDVTLGPHANASLNVTFERVSNATQHGQFTIRGSNGNETHEVTGYATVRSLHGLLRLGR